MIDRPMLRYFLAIIDNGTFTAAARHCRVSQPALSEAIAKLEQQLGHILFERDNRRVELTPAGVRFASHARRIEAEFLDAEHEAQSATPLTRLRLGLASSLPPHWVEASLAKACQNKEVQVEVTEARARDLLALLDRGRIDIAIGLTSDKASPAQQLWREGYGLALPASHHLAQASVITAEQVAGETMFVRRDCEILAEVSRYFTSHGVRPFMSARITSEERALAYVRAGLGLTVMPRSFASPGLVIIPLAGFGFTRTVEVLTDPLRPTMLASSPPLQQLIAAFAPLPQAVEFF